MITVTQLIDMLSRFPGDLRVVVRGNEMGAVRVNLRRHVLRAEALCDETDVGRGTHAVLAAVQNERLRADER